MNEPIFILPEEWSLIEAHVLGTADATELRQFEEKEAADVAWPHKVEAVRQTILGIREAGMKEKLSEFHQEFSRSNIKNIKQGSIRSFRRWMAAAAAVIVLVLALAWIFLKPSETDKQYIAYYSADPGLVTAMGPAEDYAFESGMVQYKNAEYTEAIATWSNLLPKRPDNDTLTYFLAAAYQAEGNYEQAKRLYQKNLSSSNHAFYAESAWYFGLICLKEKNLPLARKWISESNHSGADALLKSLNQ